jgi:hypothetical protein
VNAPDPEGCLRRLTDEDRARYGGGSPRDPLLSDEEWLKSVFACLGAYEDNLRDVSEELADNGIEFTHDEEKGWTARSESIPGWWLKRAFEYGWLIASIESLRRDCEHLAKRSDRAKQNPARARQSEERRKVIQKRFGQWCGKKRVGVKVQEFVNWHQNKYGTDRGYSPANLRRAVADLADKLAVTGRRVKGLHPRTSRNEQDKLVQDVLCQHRDEPGVTEFTVWDALIRDRVIRR